MKRMLSLAVVAACGVAASAQTHKVAKTQDVVRAVGVYEWTGELNKPTASRLIPVTVFIDGALQDGGVYLARPVPFALQSGNLYELDLAGMSKGNLELAYARHLRAVDTATGESVFDDGWFGYGNFKAPAAARKTVATLKPSTQLSQVTSSKDDGKPHFSNKQPAASGADSTASAKDSPAKDSSTKDSASDSSKDSTTASSTGSTPAGDPDRPTMRRRDGSSGSKSSNTSSVSDAGTPADDPDRPHLTRKTSTDDSVPPDPNDKQGGSGSGTAGSGNAGSSTTASSKAPEGGSADDPDRPTLKRRTPQDAKAAQKKGDVGSVTQSGLLADDPDRPNLHRGKPASAMNEDDLPKLTGLPKDLHQMVAVSDATNRDSHDFARPWEDDAERAAILSKMQALARVKLAAYGAPATAVAATPPPPAPKPGTAAAAAARRAAAAKAAAAKKAPAPVPLMDEELKGFMLSYGGAPTYVYTAHTDGTGAAAQYVTIVAQTDAMGEFKPALQSVTDAAHLDRTPRMRLVDAVDVEASNRASLLFELRGEQSRQFGIYRVIGAQASQTFVTGSTQ
jgi:hypothetical protein